MHWNHGSFATALTEGKVPPSVPRKTISLAHIQLFLQDFSFNFHVLRNVFREMSSYAVLAIEPQVRWLLSLRAMQKAVSFHTAHVTDLRLWQNPQISEEHAVVLPLALPHPPRELIYENWSTPWMYYWLPSACAERGRKPSAWRRGLWGSVKTLLWPMRQSRLKGNICSFLVHACSEDFSISERDMHSIFICFKILLTIFRVPFDCMNSF